MRAGGQTRPCGSKRKRLSLRSIGIEFDLYATFPRDAVGRHTKYWRSIPGEVVLGELREGKLRDCRGIEKMSTTSQE